MARSCAQELAIYLRTLDLGGGVGAVTIKVDGLPATPDVAGAVQNYGGLQGEEQFGTPGLYLERPRVQVLFRGGPGDSEGPRLMADAAMRALAAVQAEALSGTLYHTVLPASPPFKYDVDGNDRFVWAFNLQVEKELSS